MRPLALARAVAGLTLTKKAENVVLLDLRGLTSMADFFVVCSADSDIQVNAIARAVEEGMEARGVSAWHTEKGSGNWVLLDYVDVVLHIFHKHARQFYSLEKLWGDAKITPVGDEVPVSQAPAKVAAGGEPGAAASATGGETHRPVTKGVAAKKASARKVAGKASGPKSGRKGKRPSAAKTRTTVRKRTRPAAGTTKRTKSR